MWADNETSEDLLGFKVHADLLIDIVNDESVLPITIGVFGDWGSGKSSILQIVKENFDEDENKDSLCIYFNGWTFEGYDDAKAALLNSILKELGNNKKLSDKVKDTVKEKAKKLWKSVDWMRGAGMLLKNISLPAVSAYFTGGISLLPYAAQKISEWGDDPEQIIKKLKSEEGKEIFSAFVKEKKEEEKSDVNAVAEFRKDFAELLEATKFKRLIVIIDDLDRCSPERIIENLEAIKLFLNVPKTAFIIGADPRIVKYAIEHKYKNNKEIEEDNNRIIIDYLEKLIQLPYALPRLSESEVETYISMLICKKEIDNTGFIKVLDEFKKYREKNKYSAFGLSNFESILKTEDFQKVKNNVITIPSLVPLITNSLYGNPRQIKRFLNTYTIRKRLAKVASLQSFNYAVLAKMMILEYSEPKLFKRLFEWQISQDGMPKEIIEIEAICKDKGIEDILSEFKDSEFKEWSKPKIIKWFQIEPLISGVDLRDYYWIARDKLENSITATSMIPPVVRALFNELLPDSMTATVTKSLLKEKFVPFNGLERDAFFNLISSNIKRKPQQKRLYDIFNIMLEEKIENTAYHYKEALKIVSINDIEPAVAARLADFRSEPEIGEFLTEYFKEGNSRASRAFKLKKQIMGTSKSFSDVKHSMVPNWGNLSSSLTSNCDSSTLPAHKLENIMGNFVSTLSSAAVGGRGGSRVGGRSSIRTAKKIGGVFSKFISSGNNVRETLESTGLSDIDNKTVGDIINHLIEYCSGSATSIDDIAAKEATRLLLEELIGQAESIDEVEILLQSTFNGSSLEDIIIKYFAYYINELLSKWFYENLIKSKNESDCNNLFTQIKNYIVEKVADMHKRNPLQNVDWSSNEADRFLKNIQHDVLIIFEQL